MSKPWKPGKKTVELQPSVRPSRIRRDPVRPDTPVPETVQWWDSREWEIGLALIGILLFALAINALLFGISAVTSY
jgi:hypothetical protein